ncbi:MAG TPA: hypothetical protein VHD60_03235 [Candidatus Saccharimonadales bacterium]|nr:hypothetical protein [Candidatus Saccharimonadales bacterium]
MSRRDIRAFQQEVLGYYAAHGRHDLPWRAPEPDGSFDSYKILVSEVMLQQTQVSRVIPIYQKAIYRFPTVSDLARAELGEVLRMWQGLGYNRRAKFLHQAAQMVVKDFGGEFPASAEELVKLPGVGKNTAGAVLAYAFNKPAAFVETNIRTVFIHHFFKDQTDIPDGVILELLGKTVDAANPREFYWALMDYGTFLKQTVGNLSRASKSYVRQSPLEGSRRQVRGQVLRLLTQRAYSPAELQEHILDHRLNEVLQALQNEGMISLQNGLYEL